MLALASVTPAQPAPATIVSLTFDDGNADQMNALPALQQYRVPATFYIISGFVGAPDYVTEANVSAIAAAGNEIGGHTVSHVALTTVPADEAKRQVCDDRVNLSKMGARLGFPTPTSFAYPYAAYNRAIERIVSRCGYNNARSLGDIESAHSAPGVRARSGRIPPVDAEKLPAVDEIDNPWTLAQMQSVVTKAEKIGGWVIFTFHHVCAGTRTTCSALAISQTTFTSFVSWLKTRPATTSVKTIGEVIGGSVKPPVPGPAPTFATGMFDMLNPSLEPPAARMSFG